MTLPRKRAVLAAGIAAVAAGGFAGAAAWADDRPGDPTDDRPPGIPAEEQPHPVEGGDPKTIADAQRRLDPSNDPHRLIGQHPDGSFYMVDVAMNGEPPAWVVTVEDFKQWQVQNGAK